MRVGNAANHGGFLLKRQMTELSHGSGYEVADYRPVDSCGTCKDRAFSEATNETRRPDVSQLCSCSKLISAKS